MFPCPHCGEPVPGDAKACPHCGSDPETGWNPDAEYLSVDLPDEPDAGEPEEPPSKPSNAFSVLLLVVAALGLIALWGLRRVVANPLSVLGAVLIVAVIIVFMRRPSRK